MHPLTAWLQSLKVQEATSSPDDDDVYHTPRESDIESPRTDDDGVDCGSSNCGSSSSDGPRVSRLHFGKMLWRDTSSETDSPRSTSTSDTPRCGGRSGGGAPLRPSDRCAWVDRFMKGGVPVLHCCDFFGTKRRE